jgi:hypothetical protein
VRRKPLKGGEWGYFFDVPSTLLKAGCPVHREALGIDYAKAVERAEKMLLPLLDEWQGRRRGGDKDADQGSPTSIAVTGTLDWVFAEYRADRRFTSWTPRPSAIMRSRLRAERWSTTRRGAPDRYHHGRRR